MGHRIGRTGRAGRKGKAVTLFTEDDAVYLKSIANVMREAGCDVPDYMLDMKTPSKKAGKNGNKKKTKKPKQAEESPTKSAPKGEKKKKKTEIDFTKIKSGATNDKKDMKQNKGKNHSVIAKTKKVKKAKKAQ